MAKAKPKGKGGRPSLYKPEYCDLVVKLGSEGKSKAQIASLVGVERHTLNAWADAHEEFSTAIKRARELELAWWENIGQDGLLLGKQFNATAFIFQMKNRFKEDYSDKQEVSVSGQIAFLQLLKRMNGEQ